MGYYTYHTLTVEQWADNSAPPEEVLCAVECAMRAHEILGYAFCSRDGNEFDSGDAVKWYEHDTDMASLSMLFPELLFVLHGEGEENGDLWDAYYHAGTMQHCQAELIYPEFDREQMIPIKGEKWDSTDKGGASQ